MIENNITEKIIGAAIEVHRTLGGPGLLESVYEEAMIWEMRHRGLFVEQQVHTPIVYKGHTLATPLRVDLIVEKKVIVENKAVTEYKSVFGAQTLTYLRLRNLRLGLVINFGERYVKHGIRRIINPNYQPPS